MRTIDRLSYSAMSLWESDPDEFYLTRMADCRPPRIPQERPAAAGSAFDAYVKAAAYGSLYGNLGDAKYSLEALFESQVEKHTRDWAWEEGAYIFECYAKSGFYDNLMEHLEHSSEPPRFEFTVEAIINGVPFLGKPDCRWVTPGLVKIVHDFKLNGYCSKHAVSPCKSYMLCRDGYTSEKPSKSHGTEHKEFLAHQHGDMIINASYMEASNSDWADQLTLYGWALGEKIGDEDVVLSVHQIVAKPMPESRPQLRVAQYRARVARSHQLKLADRIKKCWDSITTGHIFSDMSRADSDARCALLDASKPLPSDGSAKNDFFTAITKPRYMG